MDFSRLEYYLLHKPKIDQDRVRLYSRIYENYMTKITRDISSDLDLLKFYKFKYKLMKNVYDEFGLTRLGNYILYCFNIERDHFLNL
jgi:PKD repeat protein